MINISIVGSGQAGCILAYAWSKRASASPFIRTFDPVCGQGGNFASRSAKLLAEEVGRHGDLPFDEVWMTEVNSRL